MLLLDDDLLDAPADRFDDYRRAVNANALRLGVVITVAVQLPFLIFEWLALHDQFLFVQALRAVWLVPTVMLYPYLRRPSSALLGRVDAIIWLIYVASAAYIVMVAFLDRGYQSPYIHGLILMFVGVGAVTLWSFPFSATFAGAVYGAYWLPFLLGHGEIGDGADWIGYQCFMVGTMGIVLVSQQLRLQMARADFERRCRLEEKEVETRELLQEVAEVRQERLTWLESLAHFLRHELKNQMVAMGTSLDLAQASRPGAGSDRYLGRARRSLSAMNHLVQSATEATSLEAALSLESVEPVELSEVVAERVMLFRRAHPGRRFRAHVKSGLCVGGQEDRLAQLLDNLLENAVRHTGANGEIRVSLMEHHTELILCVENEGDRLPPNPEKLFDAFVTRANGFARPENLGLGLFVARVIAEAHGGRIAARDLEGKTGARFELRLPIG